MKTTRIGSFIFAVTFISWTACDDTPLESPVETPTFAKGGAPGPPDSDGGDDGDGGGGETSAETVITYSDRSGDRITSDGRGAYDGSCGELSDFNLGDARMDPDMNWTGRLKKTCVEPRAISIDFGDRIETGGWFMNVDQAEGETGTGLHRAQFNGAGCNRLIFSDTDDWVGATGADKVEVAFDDAGTADPADDTWTVRTTDADGDGIPAEAHCEADGAVYSLPFELTIRRR